MIDLKTHKDGYYGYLNQDIREALAATQERAAHFDTSFVVGGPTGVATHGLTIMSGGLKVESDAAIVGELLLVSGKLVINSTVVPKHADNAAALAAGLEIGHVYITPDGTMKTVILP
jgi:hypothetical protein